MNILIWSSIHSVCILQAQNSYKDEYDETEFIKKPILLIKLKISDSKVTYWPRMGEIRERLLKCFQSITNAATNLPRVSLVYPNTNK